MPIWGPAPGGLCRWPREHAGRRGARDDRVAVLRHDVAEWVLGLPVAAAFGFTFAELADGRSVTRLVWHHRHSHTPGAFQASPIAALADFTGASAAMTLLPVGGVGATMDCTVKFLAEARGDELVARGHVLRPGRTVTVASVDVYAVSGLAETSCAAALVTIRNIVTEHHRPERPAPALHSVGPTIGATKEEAAP